MHKATSGVLFPPIVQHSWSTAWLKVAQYFSAAIQSGAYTEQAEFSSTSPVRQLMGSGDHIGGLWREASLASIK